MIGSFAVCLGPLAQRPRAGALSGRRRVSLADRRGFTNTGRLVVFPPPPPSSPSPCPRVFCMARARSGAGTRCSWAGLLPPGLRQYGGGEGAATRVRHVYVGKPPQMSCLKLPYQPPRPPGGLPPSATVSKMVQILVVDLDVGLLSHVVWVQRCGAPNAGSCSVPLLGRRRGSFVAHGSVIF